MAQNGIKWKGSFTGYFLCQRQISVLYNLYLAGEMGLYSSNSESPTPEEKQRESVHSSLLSCHLKYNYLPLVKPAKYLISFLLKNNYAYLQVDNLLSVGNNCNSQFGFSWFLYIVFCLLHENFYFSELGCNHRHSQYLLKIEYHLVFVKRVILKSHSWISSNCSFFKKQLKFTLKQMYNIQE